MNRRKFLGLAGRGAAVAPVVALAVTAEKPAPAEVPVVQSGYHLAQIRAERDAGFISLSQALKAAGVEADGYAMWIDEGRVEFQRRIET